MDEPIRLDRVLTARQLRVYYQPFVRLDRFEVAGYQALLRWAHPERGILDRGRVPRPGHAGVPASRRMVGAGGRVPAGAPMG